MTPDHHHAFHPDTPMHRTALLAQFRAGESTFQLAAANHCDQAAITRALVRAREDEQIAAIWDRPANAQPNGRT